MSYNEDFEAKLTTLRNTVHLIPGVIIVHRIADASVVYMSPNGLQKLGTTLEEIVNLGALYNQKYFNPDESRHYAPEIMALMQKKDDDDFFTFFQQVKVADKPEMEWYISSIKVFMRSATGEPTHTIVMAFPVNTSHLAASDFSRLLAENNFIRENRVIYDSLSSREKEVLAYLTSGLSAQEIGEKLHLSNHTVDTHRRNIKRKLGVSSLFHLAEYARIFRSVRPVQ